MLEEALVIFACLNSKGCSETSSLYYNRRPEMKQVMESHERKLKKVIGPTVVELLGPVLFVAAGGTGTVRIDKTFSLQINKQSSILFLRSEF